MWIVLFIGAGLLVLAGILLWTGRETQRLVNVMKQAVPTTAVKVQDAFPGELISVTGVTRCDRPLLSEHGKVPSVYYSSSVERDYESTEYEHGTKDRAGRYVTRRHSETVSSNTQSIAFDVEDETGRARVVPDDAEFDARESMNRYDSAGNNGSTFSIGGFSVNLGNGDRTIGYRYKESVIPVDTPIYVVGIVSEDGEIAKPHSNQQNGALIVSYRSQSALIEDWQSSARWQAYGSIGSATAGIGAIFIAAVMAFV